MERVTKPVLRSTSGLNRSSSYAFLMLSALLLVTAQPATPCFIGNRISVTPSASFE